MRGHVCIHTPTHTDTQIDIYLYVYVHISSTYVSLRLPASTAKQIQLNC